MLTKEKIQEICKSMMDYYKRSIEINVKTPNAWENSTTLSFLKQTYPEIDAEAFYNAYTDWVHYDMALKDKHLPKLEVYDYIWMKLK